MGIISDKAFDAFLSYASADQPKFVSAFRRRLERRLKDETVREGLNTAGRDAEIFMDSTGLPANGSLNEELKRKIDQSEFLVIFVGKAYLKSPWCKKELDWFVRRFRGKREQAIKRTFVILLEDDVKNQAEWPKFLDEPTRLRYISYYDARTDSTIPPFLVGDDYQAEINPQFERRLNEIVETMIDRAQESAPSSPGARATAKRSITVGVTTRDLDTTLAAMSKTLLEEHGIRSVLLSAEDLVSDHAEEVIREKTGQSDLFVQPFTYAPVRSSFFADGGHLKLMEKLIGEQVPTLWWRVEQTDGVIASGDPGAESKQEHLAFLQQMSSKVEQSGQHGDTSALVAHIASKLPTLRPAAPIARPRIYIESGVDEKEVYRLLRGEIERLWRDEFDEDAPLCYPMPWEQMRRSGKDILSRCHGLILIYGKKDYQALETQVTTLDELILDTRSTGGADAPEPARAISMVCPPQHFGGDLFWLSFPCELCDDTLKIQDEGKVRALLHRIHDSIAPSANPVAG